MRKFIITAELRDIEAQYAKGEITYSKIVEILCQKADKYAQQYHEQELKKLKENGEI